MIHWKLLAGGAVALGAAVFGVTAWKHRNTVVLDANLPAATRDAVLKALRDEDDPVKLDALADTLAAYPLAQAALRAKAANIRTHMNQANPPSPSVSPSTPVGPPQANPVASPDHIPPAQTVYDTSPGPEVAPGQAGGGGAPDSPPIVISNYNPNPTPSDGGLGVLPGIANPFVPVPVDDGGGNVADNSGSLPGDGNSASASGG